MTATSSPARPLYHHMGEPISSPDVIDFFTERDRLVAEIDLRVRKSPALRSHATTLFDRLEDCLYSLISAAALVSVLWGILSLADFTTPRTHRAGTEQSEIVLRGMPSRANLDSSGKSLTAQPQGVTLLPY
jgi:hypothetical protein